MKSGMDYIEVGRGTESKVIGQGNSISEYMTTIFALCAYIGQGFLVVWFMLAVGLWLAGLVWSWAIGISLILTIVLTIGAVYFVFWAYGKIKQMQEPMPTRDEKGRFRRARVNNMGRHVGDLITAENGETEYVERWGGGGRASES